jgi:hypothetical protein
MNRRTATLLATAMLTLGSLGVATTASAQSTTPTPADSGVSRSHTPDDCIRLNGGDLNACNVDNSGAGDLPYRHATVRTPNDCIRLNQGDYNACNVDNSGAGDLPYMSVSR